MKILEKSFRGRPSINEDCCKGLKNGKTAIIAAADGVQPNGKAASRYAIECIIKEESLGMDINELRKLIINTNCEMFENQIGQTTLTVVHALIDEKDENITLRCFNAGDTRCYVLYGNREIKLLTKDHRTADCYEQLTSCLGDEQFELYFSEIKLPRKNLVSVLVLTDGAWEYILERDRCYDKHTEFIACSQFKRPEERYKHFYRRLLLGEKRNKLHDNATIITLEI